MERRSPLILPSGDVELNRLRSKTRDLLRVLNRSREKDVALRSRILKELLGPCGTEVGIEPPFYCDFGKNITFGSRVFVNFNCTFLDAAPITIGDNVLIGPGVQLFATGHPLEASKRRDWHEESLPIIIEDDVWIAGGAIICQGITIGARSVIGAGTVVRKSVPPDHLAIGERASVLQIHPLWADPKLMDEKVMVPE